MIDVGFFGDFFLDLDLDDSSRPPASVPRTTPSTQDDRFFAPTPFIVSYRDLIVIAPSRVPFTAGLTARTSAFLNLSGIARS